MRLAYPIIPAALFLLTARVQANVIEYANNPSGNSTDFASGVSANGGAITSLISAGGISSLRTKMAPCGLVGARFGAESPQKFTRVSAE